MHQFAMLCKQLETPFSSSWSRHHHSPSTQVNLLITSTHSALQSNMLLIQALAFISTRELIVALDLGASVAQTNAFNGSSLKHKEAPREKER